MKEPPPPPRLGPSPFIDPPRPLPLLYRLAGWLARRRTGLELRVPQILAWHPKTALGSAMLEGLVAHGRRDLDPRMLKLVRMAVSFAVSCPFCIDMSSHRRAEYGITAEVVRFLQGGTVRCPSLSDREVLAVEYARSASATPLYFSPQLIARLKQAFTPREMVVLASTAAQVNYWARLLQALGVPAAGFSSG